MTTAIVHTAAATQHTHKIRPQIHVLNHVCSAVFSYISVIVHHSRLGPGCQMFIENPQTLSLLVNSKHGRWRCCRQNSVCHQGTCLSHCYPRKNWKIFSRPVSYFCVSHHYKAPLFITVCKVRRWLP